ncbi:MAG TPA: pyridoxal-phosphate dependent enzyme, partial [Thermoanaerobaculia bacterium]|nr:pyridoxal-phosphate dependent enzyme [Thermoanaerobaculia bacterium]
ADDAARSLASGRLESNPPGPVATIADGLKTGICERTFAILSRHLERVVAVEEEEIAAAMRTVWERMKLVVEPSAAVPVAALLSAAALAGWQGERPPRVGVVLSGGNVDLDHLPWTGAVEPGPGATNE